MIRFYNTLFYKGLMSVILSQLRPNASIVILTGAGISAESGLQTFRASDGLWEGHKVEDVATPEAFARDPVLVHDFYNMRRRDVLAAAPNPAHIALAELEQKWAGDILIVTQNIDDLHDRAGSANLIHMHGEVLKSFCTHCARDEGHEHTTKFEIRANLSTAEICPECEYAGGVRPDIVWFGELPYAMDKIFDALQNADLFIAIGTSGHVYPAAGFVSQARGAGALTIECNLEPSKIASNFDDQIIGPAGATIPALVQSLLKL